jgi:UDP-2,3-diacylglucosamine hydrolase
MAEKTFEIMDVNAGAVARQMQRFGVTRLIHGHTHRPADHRLNVNGQPSIRHVLPDWRDDHAGFLVQRNGEWKREQWTGAPG